MEVQDLKHMIQSKDIPNFMIFTGEEWMVQKIYIQQIAKVVNLEVKYIDSISDIWNTLNSRMLLGKNYLYVLRDDREFITEEKLYSQIQNRLSKNMLILQLTSVDKRLKILKTYNNTTFEFNALKSDILMRYIQNEITLPDEHIGYLMEICEYNYGRCLLEVDKIKHYVNSIKDNAVTATQARLQYPLAFAKLATDGTIYIPPRDAIFDFIKAVMQHRVKLVYELFEELKESKEPTLIILSNLYNLAKWTYQLQTCSSKDIAKSTGLNNWQIRNAKECANVYTNEDLEYLMRLIQKVESGIKRGLIEDAIAVDYVLVSFL